MAKLDQWTLLDWTLILYNVKVNKFYFITKWSEVKSVSWQNTIDIYEVNGHLLEIRHVEAVLLIHDDEQKYKIKDNIITGSHLYKGSQYFSKVYKYLTLSLASLALSVILLSSSFHFCNKL